MRLLLDTHTFLWAISEPDRLSQRAGGIILDQGNELILSAVSLWEIVVKVEAGKLRLPASAEFLEAHVSRLGVRSVLPITPVHVYAVWRLPRAHKDPFDRLLAAQCEVENLPILSADASLRDYPIEVVW